MKKALSAVRAWCGGHKKLTATVVAALVQLVPGNVLAPDVRTKVLEAILVYVGAQGIADHGKEAAKVQAAAATSGRVVGAIPSESSQR